MVGQELCRIVPQSEIKKFSFLVGGRREGAKVLDKGKDMAPEYMAKALSGTGERLV